MPKDPKVPNDLGDADWDSLLDALDGPAAPLPPVESVVEAKAPTPPPAPARTPTPSAPVAPTAPSAPAAAPPRPAPPRPPPKAPTPPPAPVAKAPTPPPAPVAKSSTPAPAAASPLPPFPKLAGADDLEDERTVVGVIPQEIMAESRRGGRSGGLEQLMQRAEPTPPPRDALPTPAAGQDELDVDEVLTSAPVLANRPPPPPPPRSEHGPASAPAANDDLEEPEPPPRSDEVALVDPFAPRSSGAPSLDVGEASEEDLEGLDLGDAPELPESRPGPKLISPSERMYPEDEVTQIGKAPDPQAPADDEVDDAAPPSSGPKLPSAPPAPKPTSMRPNVSMAPAPLPDGEAAWPDESDAVSHTTFMGIGDEMTARAEWIAAEARLLDDKVAKGRMLLQAAEMLSLVGEDDKASALAEEAKEGLRDHPLVHQALRAVAVRSLDHAAVVEAIDAELKVTTAPERRGQLMLAAATLTRVALRDHEGAAKRLDLAARVAVDDARAHVGRVARDLAAPGALAKHKWPETEAFASLRAAADRVAAARSGEPGGGPEAALSRARAAAERGDASATVDALSALEPVREVGEAAGWLAAALAAPRKETRASAVGLLGKLRGGTLPREAARSLAARAVEQGDFDAIGAALREEGSFGANEAAALAALSGDTELAFGLARSLGDAARPLASAVVAAGDPAHDPPPVGGALAPVLGLGRALGRSRERTTSLDALSGDDAPPVVGALRAEAHLDQKRAAELAGALGLDGSLERLQVAAILRELAGDAEGAKATLRAALDLEPGSEACVRALASLDRAAEPGLFAALARTTDDGPKRALWLLGAALAEEGAERHELLRESHESAPQLGIASLLGARFARQEGDAERLVAWVRARREACDGGIERAHEEVREAMQIADQDLDAAVSLLESAGAARPSDVALGVLLARLGREPARRPIDDILAEQARATPAARQRVTLLLAIDAFRRGDQAGASRAALAGAGTRLASLLSDDVDAAGPTASRLADALMERARATENPEEERELYLRLAELDERGRGDLSSALLWHRTILEKDPTSLVSLRQLAQVLLGEGREDELEPIFASIAKAVSGREAVAHAVVASRLRQRTAGWETTRDLAETAIAQSPSPLWGERQLAAHGVVADDPQLTARAATALLARTDRPRERATLLLRAGEARLALGRPGEAAELFKQAVDLVPEHPTAPEKLARALLAANDAAGAASWLERAADASDVEAHQLALRHEAGLLWLDRAHDSDKGLRALEIVADVDTAYGETFGRLRVLYTERSDGPKLASLLERRLATETDPERRVELEVTRGRALREIGDVEAAKAALAAALDASPDHPEALVAFADLCTDDGDAAGAEQALIRLARLEKDPSRQVDLYRRLGALYRGPLDNLERAEASYREVQKRDPDDVASAEELLSIYIDQKNVERALEVQAGLQARAKDPAEKRRRTIELAKVQEVVVGDVKKAEQILEALRKEQPHDPHALRALAELHLRQNHGPAANVLLDRAANDARRALHTGRFELHLFSTLATVFELRGNHDAAAVAQATVDALEGRTADVLGTGFRAGRPQLDDLLAPEVFTPAFRSLLRHVSGAVDAATAVDLRGLRAAPFPVSAQGVANQLLELASAFGVNAPQLLVSPAVGPIIVPVSTHPPVLVFGAALVAEPNEAIRNFLAIRAFKIVQAGVSAFTRTAPIDLGPLAAGILQTLAPSWSPSGVDAHKLSDFRGRIQRSQVGALSPEASALALEVIGTLGNKASTLQTAANAWGNRAALLATGDLKGALDAIAYAAGQPQGAPGAGPDRVKWIGRNAEARDLVVFGVSNEYADARKA